MKIYAMLLTASLVSDNCVNKLWYLNAVEYNVAIKISIRNYSYVGKFVLRVLNKRNQ